MQLTILQGKLTSVYKGVDFNMGIKMAATMLVVLPVIAFFFILQSRFMKSMANTGLAN